MKIILKEDVELLGKQGDIKEVKSGFARNYLFPKKLALPATAKNIKAVEEYKKYLQKKQEKFIASQKQLAEKLKSLSLTITTKAGEDETLFGSITSQDIAQELAKYGIEIDKRKIILEEPIKKLGIYHIPIHLLEDITATVKLWVIKD